MFTKFSVTGSSLELLRPGEQGVISYCKSQDEKTLRKLISLGLTPGTKIILEQRFPSFIIKAGHTRLALDREIASVIYVRVGE